MRHTCFIATAICAGAASPSYAAPFFTEVEPNNSPAAAQFVDAELGGNNRFGSAYVDGVVEGAGAGLFDFFTFEVAPFGSGLTLQSGSVFASGLDASTGTIGQAPLVALFDGSGNRLASTNFFGTGRYIVGVGRSEGSTATSYRLVLSAFAIPEPSTWALMLAGFAMTGYAMRRRRVAFA